MQEAGDEGAELWTKVQDENDPLTLDGAIQTLQECISARERAAAEARKVAEQQRKLSTGHLETIINLACPWPNWTVEQTANEFPKLYEARYSEFEITSEKLFSCSDVLKHLAEKCENNGEKNPAK